MVATQAVILCVVSLSVLGAAQDGLIRYNEVLFASCTGVQGRVLEQTVSRDLSHTITVASNSSCVEAGGEYFQGINVNVFSANATEEHPVVVVARQGMREKIFSWRIPYYPSELNISFDSLDRTLCPVNISSEEELVYLDVYTTSPQPIHYQLSAQLLPNFKLEINDIVEFQVTPASPRIFYYKFPPEQSVVMIQLNSLTPPSSTSGCFILSAQRNSCPFNYLAEDIKKSGFFQTVNGTTVLLVHKGEIFSDEIIIAVVAVNRTRCNVLVNSTIYSKETFNLTIGDTPPLSEFGLMIAAPFLVFFVGILPIVIIFTVLHVIASCDFKLFCKIRLTMYKFGHKLKGNGHQSGEDEGDAGVDQKSEEDHQSETDAGNKGTVQYQIRMETMEELGRLREEAAGYVAEEKKKYWILTGGKLIWPCKVQKHLMLEEPSEDYVARVNRHFMFLWNTLIISIYYGLPALQHLYTLIEITKFTGEGDRCYFNYKCSHSLGKLTSFNNFYSNVAYLLFGGLFLVIAIVKNVIYCMKKRKKAIQDYTGVPTYFGIFYAMGMLAIMQGLMSALYHICPTQANFQYDNASMVIFGGLVIVHIVHKRHPVQRLNAGLTYVLFSIITSLILGGLIIDNFTGVGWREFLCVVFFLLALSFTFAFYRLHDKDFLGGYPKKDSDEADGPGNKFFKWLRNNKGKICKVTFGTILNILIAVIYFLNKDASFANYVLALFLINDAFFVIIYFVAKSIYREYFSLMSTIMAIMTFVFIVPAVLYLNNTQYQTRDTPSMSRQLNGDCSLGGFYDNHDLWHFLSSIAMFFCYVFLMTLDDGEELKRRWKLHTF